MIVVIKVLRCASEVNGETSVAPTVEQIYDPRFGLPNDFVENCARSMGWLVHQIVERRQGAPADFEPIHMEIIEKVRPYTITGYKESMLRESDAHFAKWH